MAQTFSSPVPTFHPGIQHYCNAPLAEKETCTLAAMLILADGTGNHLKIPLELIGLYLSHIKWLGETHSVCNVVDYGLAFVAVRGGIGGNGLFVFRDLFDSFLSPGTLTLLLPLDRGHRNCLGR